MNDTATQPAPASPDAVIVARGASYYRWTRYAFSALLLGMAAWFGYDGYVKYPRDNELHLLHVRNPQQYPDDYPTHDATSILLQKVLAATLPFVALGLVGWTLYRSRGAYRLSGEVLSVPGHPDVPLSAITTIDKSKWDRKGIAKIDYDLPGRKGRLTLDDFIYDRPPTDQILETIEAKLGVAAPDAPPPAPPDPAPSDTDPSDTVASR
jgi:hypothetical protein